jgi:ABC-type Fe3+ transport system permease subunit
VASAFTWLPIAAILVGPPASVPGLLVWSRRLKKQGTPRLVVWTAYMLAVLVGLVIAFGYVGAVLFATRPVNGGQIEPSQKARALAEGARRR